MLNGQGASASAGANGKLRPAPDGFAAAFEAFDPECTGKVGYGTAASAHANIRRMEKRHGLRVRGTPEVYRCTRCRDFHIRNGR